MFNKNKDIMAIDTKKKARDIVMADAVRVDLRGDLTVENARRLIQEYKSCIEDLQSQDSVLKIECSECFGSDILIPKDKIVQNYKTKIDILERAIEGEPLPGRYYLVRENGLS